MQSRFSLKQFLDCFHDKRARFREKGQSEKAEGNYSAYVPDLPGCVATGATVEEVRAEIREAIVFHIDGLREDGIPIPEPTSAVGYIELAA